MPAVRLLAVSRPESYSASLRARWVQAGEFRLHFRDASVEDALPDPGARPCCALGFVLPKRQCRHAARRNLIRRVAREALRDLLRKREVAQDASAAIPTPIPTPIPVLVLRLQSRLDAQWVSAQSPALRRYLRQTMSQLLADWERARSRARASR